MEKINYDKFSQIYDISRSINFRTIKDLVRLTHVNSNSIVLDLGCGTGNYTAALKNVAHKVIGLDISLGMIEKARVKVPNSDFINSNIMFLPFKSCMFDRLYGIQVIHHVKDKMTFLKEAYRVLKENGYLAIHTCSHDQINTYWYYHYFPEGLNKDLKRIPDVKEVISLLKKAGFLKIRVKSCYYDTVISNQSPENYLDKNFRNGDSTFALLTSKDIESGCKKLRKDIKSGFINKIIEEYKKKVDLYGGSSIVYCKKSKYQG